VMRASGMVPGAAPHGWGIAGLIMRSTRSWACFRPRWERGREGKVRLGRRRGRCGASGVDRRGWERQCRLRPPQIRSRAPVNGFFLRCGRAARAGWLFRTDERSGLIIIVEILDLYIN
jgi:hypothetical protein